MPTVHDGRPRVADFSTHISGPMASRYLAQLGADVIKIEDPAHGDGNRGFPPFAQGLGVQHLSLNPGTRSLAVSASSDQWPRTVAAVAAWADVVIVGNRPETAARLGIDYASLRVANPRLVYCLITGYGLGGEWSGMPAHGLNMDAMAGAVPVDWAPDGIPSIPAAYRSAGTTLAGMNGALGIYAALLRVAATGHGQLVHVSIWESALAWMWRDTTTHANAGHAWTNYQDLGTRYAVYKAGDGQALLVCPIERKFWLRFADLLELPADVRERGDYRNGTDAGAAYAALGERALIQSRLELRSRDEWMTLLANAQVPAAPILDWREAMASPHAADNGSFARYELRDATIVSPVVPVSVSDATSFASFDQKEWAAAHAARQSSLGPPPGLGQDNEALLRELGLD
ncbi:CoA transferase [soil metagenome]